MQKAWVYVEGLYHCLIRNLSLQLNNINCSVATQNEKSCVNCVIDVAECFQNSSKCDVKTSLKSPAGRSSPGLSYKQQKNDLIQTHYSSTLHYGLWFLNMQSATMLAISKEGHFINFIFNTTGQKNYVQSIF